MKRVLKWVGIAFLYLVLFSVSVIVWEVLIGGRGSGGFSSVVLSSAVMAHVQYHKRKWSKRKALFMVMIVTSIYLVTLFGGLLYLTLRYA